MMPDRILLTITADDRLVQLLRWQIQDHEGGRAALDVAAAIDEACPRIETLRPRLIVVDWGRGGRFRSMNQLLWTATTLSHPVPVVVVTDWYRTAEATRLYRMGVADYISRSHHEHRFARILDTYLRGELDGRYGAGATAGRRRHRPAPRVVARPRPALSAS